MKRIFIVILFIPYSSSLITAQDLTESELDSSTIDAFEEEAIDLANRFISQSIAILHPRLSNEDKQRARAVIIDLFKGSNSSIYDYIERDGWKYYSPEIYGRKLMYIDMYRLYYSKKYKLSDTISLEKQGYKDKYGNNIYKGNFYYIEELKASMPVGHTHYVFTEEKLKKLPFTLRHNEAGKYALYLGTITYISKDNAYYDEIRASILYNGLAWNQIEVGELPEVTALVPSLDSFDCKNGKDTILYIAESSPITTSTKVVFSINDQDAYWYIPSLDIKEEGLSFIYEFKNPGQYTVKAITKRDNYCDKIQVKVVSGINKAEYTSPTVMDYIIPGIGHDQYGKSHFQRYAKVGIYSSIFVGATAYAIYHKIQKNKYYKLHMNARTIRNSDINYTYANNHHKKFMIGTGVALLTWVVNAIHLKISDCQQRKYFGIDGCFKSTSSKSTLSINPVILDNNGIGLSLKVKF